MLASTTIFPLPKNLLRVLFSLIHLLSYSLGKAKVSTKKWTFFCSYCQNFSWYMWQFIRVDIFSPFVFFRRIHGLGCSHVLAWSTSRWRWKSWTSTIHYKEIWNQRTKNQIGHWYVHSIFLKNWFFFFF